MNAMLCQVVFLREILSAAQGNELLIGIFFFCWLAGVGIGATAGGRLADSARNPLAGACLIPAVQVLLGPAIFLFLTSCRMILGIPAGTFMPPGAFLTASAIAAGLFSCLTGLGFPFLCRAARVSSLSGDVSIGSMYATDALGSIVAGVLFTFVLVSRLSPIHIILLSGLGVWIAIVFALSSENRHRITTAFGLVLGLCWAVTLFSPAGTQLNEWGQSLRWRALAPGFEHVRTEETPYQRLDLGAREGQFSLFSHGSYAGSFPDPYSAAEAAHLVMTLCPRPDRVLLLGGGSPELVREILKHPVRHLDYIEMDRALLPFVESYLEEEVRSILQDARVHLRHEDARAFVRTMNSKASDGGGYDLVWSHLPEPVTAGMNRFYTVEFFRETRGILMPGGIFVTSCAGAAGYVGDEVGQYSGSIYRSLKSAFPEVRVTPGGNLFLAAARREGTLRLDREVLGRRYEERGISSEVFSPILFQSLLDPRQVDFIEGEVRGYAVHASLNRDASPMTYLLNLRLWGAGTGSRIADRLLFVRYMKRVHIIFFMAAALAAAFFLARLMSRGRDNRSPGMIIATTGFAGMSAQIIFLYSYQTKHGALYENLGMFASCFMAGLFLSGGICTAMLGRKKPAARRTRRALLGAETGLILFFLLSAVLIRLGIQGQAVYYLMAVFAGGLIGMEFPLAARMDPLMDKKTGGTASRLERADHAGAALGALATGILLLPALGISMTLVLLAIIKLGLRLGLPTSHDT